MSDPLYQKIAVSIIFDIENKRHYLRKLADQKETIAKNRFGHQGHEEVFTCEVERARELWEGFVNSGFEYSDDGVKWESIDN